ncbi:MAG TPA: DUF2809 domain-containing protein [Chitinophagaceae bacterium]|jgi:hypothetical protein|nr:DUF2809 domain-containing protein [Chitinophagaceae bacterium]HOZ70529.1 DUF2809 domain-containing protein [Chitinophagaceae bacterium]HPH30585.1 DUF2809 domain-containing protein [Chitinophagaceae bacterium]HPN60130.1 DUF2809 domain-containing protein [Chitinophagaceae bacterium]
MLTFNLRFFLLSILFFVIEVLIALYVKDDFVRPYVGDYLVVMLIYCAVRTFIKANPVKVAIAVLLFAYMIELLQYFRIVDRLGLSGNQVAKTVIGYGFEWWDMLAYTLGVLTIVLMEKRPKKN